MLVINVGKLIDGTGSAPRKQVRLLVEEGRIADIVDAAGSTIPEGAQVLEAGDRVVMPGMIDAHVHVMWSGDDTDQPIGTWDDLVSELAGTRALKAYVHARRDLEAGFTTIRDMASLDFVDIALRDAVDKGLVEGPRISACGYGLTSTGGHMDSGNGLRPDVRLGGFDNVVDSVDEARKATRFLIRMKVDHVKINAGRGHRLRTRPLFFAPEMQLDVMQTICQEAHAAGRRVAAHSLGSEGELWAVQAGVDSLEHAHFIDDETIQSMVEHGTFLVPTMTHCVRNTLKIRENVPEDEWGDNLILWAYDSMYRVIPRAIELGVPVAVGTDAGAFGVPHGCNAQELELLTTVGMSPMQAIVAATRTGAELLGTAGSVGTLEKGKLADLLVIRGDPLQDIRLLQEKQNILVVMKQGRIVVNRARNTQGSTGYYDD
jgi:imidazolonepropionase-like amidohydrolase